MHSRYLECCTVLFEIMFSNGWDFSCRVSRCSDCQHVAVIFLAFLKQKGDYKTALRKYRKALRYLDICWEKEELDECKS